MLDDITPGSNAVHREYRTIRFRIRANPAKYKRMERHAHACRHVWNYFVAKTRNDYEAWMKAGQDPDARPSVSFFSLGVQFTELRRREPWLRELSAANIRNVLSDLANAYQRFFKEPGNGLPRFKSVHRQGLSFPLAYRQTFELQGGRLRMQKVGSVRVSGGGLYPDAVPVSGRVKQECGKWYAYIACKVAAEDVKQAGSLDRAVGVDRNVHQIACSDGRILRLPKSKRLEARRKRHQRAMARRVNGSKRHGKAKAAAAKALRKMQNIRQDWCHQITRMLANEYGVVVLEDLRVKDMTKSAKGTAENPGRNVAQKRGLNRGISESAWGLFDQMLDYKSRDAVKINPAYTSQTCNECGAVSKASRKSQASFQCIACGHEANADINAAKNILAAGMAATARGGGSDGWPVKREMNACEAA